MSSRSIDPLGLEMDLYVDENDLDSLDDDLRPPFVHGMASPVTACLDKPYNSINTMWKHWKKVHRQFLHPKSDGLCGFTEL